uniref:SET domain-containing protein n=1 Tax=Panagrolaimus davidi TaxID=227884 RepID=A0A914PV76_9BILA
MCHKKLKRKYNNNSDSSSKNKKKERNKNNTNNFVAQRRSRRRTLSEVLIEEEQALAEALDHPDCRQHFYKALYSTEIGCGLYTSKLIKKGEVVIEFKAQLVERQLITRAEGLSIERYLETQEPSPENDTYIFYFDFSIVGRAYALLVDRQDLSFFINHSHFNPNLVPKASSVNGEIRLYFIAIKDIEIHEQLFYDYCDNQSESIQNFPWLKTT